MFSTSRVRDWSLSAEDPEPASTRARPTPQRTNMGSGGARWCALPGVDCAPPDVAGFRVADPEGRCAPLPGVQPSGREGDETADREVAGGKPDESADAEKGRDSSSRDGAGVVPQALEDRRRTGDLLGVPLGLGEMQLIWYQPEGAV